MSDTRRPVLKLVQISSNENSISIYCPPSEKWVHYEVRNRRVQGNQWAIEEYVDGVCTRSGHMGGAQ